jgi:Glycosyltransferase (GlcNAc)
MNKKSIYISIPCLGFDTELFNTVNSCIFNQSKNNNIQVHIACIGNKDFYNMARVLLNNFNNVKISFFELKDNYGVGKGRNLAAKFYNNEDYFLQIDSHTLFDKDWDSQLIKTFEKALEFSKNEKTILTSYLSDYKIENDRYMAQDIKMPFSYWEINKTISVFNKETNSMSDTNIPTWKVCGIEEFKELNDIVSKDGFVNSIKVCAQFIFGNHHFAKNNCLDTDILFWEEEIIQSVELINNGFSMLYPDIDSKLHHFFTDQLTTTSRITFYEISKDLGISSTEYLEKMIKNYKKYILDKNNYEKINNYKKYSGIDLFTNTVYSNTTFMNLDV